MAGRMVARELRGGLAASGHVLMQDLTPAFRRGCYQARCWYAAVSNSRAEERAIKPGGGAMGMLLVGLGVVGLLGVPLILAAITLFATRRRISRIRHVVWLTLWLIVLTVWQMMPIFYLAGVNKATAGEGYFYVVICGGLCLLAVISWNAGRLVCRISQGAQLPAAFDAARSAAIMTLLYALAFGLLAWTRDTRWGDWLTDWPPVWLSIPVALAIATGLWRRVPIAGWAGIALAGLTLLWVFDQPAFAKRFVRMDEVFFKEPLAPLLAWLLALLLPGARSGCRLR